MKKLFLALSILSLLGASSSQAWVGRYYRGYDYDRGYLCDSCSSCNTCYSPVYYGSSCCITDHWGR